MVILTMLVSANQLAAHSFNLALLATVSGPMAGPGKNARDGFMLATTERGSHPDQESDGHLGGLDVYVTLIDPRHSPAQARGAVRELIGKSQIDFVIVADTPAVQEAIHPLVTTSEIFLIGTGPTPMMFAGAKCNPFFFSLSWPRDGNGPDRRADGRPFVGQWASDLNNPANRAFVAAFEKTYRYPPTVYAALGYDAARLIASAVRARGDTLADRKALRAALRRADFRSVRGNFKFNNNQFPIQDRLLVRQGKRVSRIVRNLAPMRGDKYAANCALK